MPPKALPKVLQIMAKTHKTTIFLQAPQAMTISELKTQALSALKQFAETYDEIPRVSSEDEFEISRAKRSKASDTVTYEVMARNIIVKDVFVNWEEVYLQFRDESGELQPVEFTPMPDGDDDDE